MAKENNTPEGGKNDDILGEAKPALQDGDNARKFAAGILRGYIDRLEHVQGEIDVLNTDKRDIYAEAKGNGFDVKAIRRIIQLRKQDANERAEQDTILETYMQALGML